MIKIEPYPIPAADLGELNPLPDIKNVSYIHAGYEYTKKLTKDELTYIGKGMIPTLLPYKIQDGYDRELKERVFRAAVLENEKLRAVFLPELGGRLWSLYDKTLGRELLYKNTVFRPANLGLRNAWFSGGVEFNVGIKGHNPLTCSPLFCEICKTPRGQVLNLYEFERIRGVVYTVSAWLPEDSDVLYLRNRIENAEGCEKHMYWWSNIAVPETKKTRVIVPADDSFLCYYEADHYKLDKTAIPNSLGTDVSYPSNLSASHDFFYKIPENERKWIASADEDGHGLLQCSTGRLLGRKLFIWGQGAGGRHWNEWLSEPGQAYIEIQAGLAHTQLEHIPMPGKTTWEWVEAYTALDGDAAKLHGDYAGAVNEVKRLLAAKVGDPEALDFPSDGEITARKPVSQASGWGALEEAVRGERLSANVMFPVSDDEETHPWRVLLETGHLPETDVSDEPVSYAVGDFWLSKLTEAAADNGSWLEWNQLGVVRYAAGDVKGAREAFERSISVKESGWARRNLAMILKNEENDEAGAKPELIRALELLPDCRALAVEVGTLLTSLGDDEEWLSLSAKLAAGLRSHGRIRMLDAIAYIHLDRTTEAVSILNPSFEMSDLKEGELSASRLWFTLYRRVYEKETGSRDDAAADLKYPLPFSLDFRMHS